MTIVIGKQIKKFRQEQQISQQELAEYLSISRQTISKWELGKSLPDLENTVRLSEYFNVSVDELLGRKKTNFLKGLLAGDKRRRKPLVDSKQDEKNNLVFYSSFAPDLKPLFQEKKRVKAFIKIEESIFPKATFSKMMGYANCLCSFDDDKVSINQIGKFKLIMNIPVEQEIAEFLLQDIDAIKLSFGKYFRNLGGNFVTLVDIITKDQSYYLWVDSLNVAYAIWHCQKFSAVTIQVEQSFQPFFALENEEVMAEEIRKHANEVPLFYGY